MGFWLLEIVTYSIAIKYVLAIYQCLILCHKLWEKMTQKLWFVNMLMQTSCDTRTLAKVGLWLIGSVWMPAQAVEHCHQNWPNRNKAVLQSSCDIWSGANVGPVAHAGVFLLKGNKQEQCSLNAIFLWHMVPCQSRPSGARRRYVLETMEQGEA